MVIGFVCVGYVGMFVVWFGFMLLLVLLMMLFVFGVYVMGVLIEVGVLYGLCIVLVVVIV